MTREEIAAMAMQGILASGHVDTLETIVNDSVIAADMLIEALADSTRSRPMETRAAALSSPKGWDEPTL